MDSHHSSALLYIQTLERIPNVMTFTHIKCLHGVREEWPRLMCLVPDLCSHVSSLLCCKHHICKHHGLQERVVTRIQNTGPVVGDWQPYSESSPEELQARHHGCGFCIKKVPLQRSQRGCALCPAEPGVPSSEPSCLRVWQWQKVLYLCHHKLADFFSFCRGSFMSWNSLLDVFFAKMGDDG